MEFFIYMKNNKNLILSIIASLAAISLFYSFDLYSIIFACFCLLCAYKQKALLPFAAVVAVFCSSYVNIVHTFALDIRYLKLSLILAFLCLFLIKRVNFSFFKLLVFTQVLLCLTFLNQANSAMIVSDDHTSFFYRLILLKKHFPYIPFYNIDWNAGYSAREFFPSGVLNVFFASSPLIYLFDIANYDNAHIYNYIILWCYVLVLPWCMYAGSRVFGLSRSQSMLAAILSIGPTMGYYRWFLKYGTLGFSFSCGMLFLSYALSYKLAFEKSSWLTVLFLLVSSFLTFTWTLSILAFLPLVVIALLNYKKTLLNKKVLCFLALFLVLNLPWMLTFIRESKVLSFVGQNSLPAVEVIEESFSFLKAFEDFKLSFYKINPFISIFFLVGIFSISKKTKKYSILGSVSFLLFLCFLGEQFKPQLELKRLIIPSSFLMCPLAALGITKWLNSKDLLLKNLNYLTLFFACSFTLSTYFETFSNQSYDKFLFADKYVDSLVQSIKEHGDENRVFFLGFVLHEMGATHYKRQDGGHVAYLPAFTGKKIYASHFYHKYWQSIDPVPYVYRARNKDGIEEFLDLINTSLVVTHDLKWINYCTSLSNRYEKVFNAGRFKGFKRKANGYFLKGSGEIKESKEGFLVKPQDRETILKFRYLPHLKTSNDKASISPYYVFDEELGAKKKKKFEFINLKVSDEVIEKGEWIKIGYF